MRLSKRIKLFSIITLLVIGGFVLIVTKSTIKTTGIDSSVVKEPTIENRGEGIGKKDLSHHVEISIKDKIKQNLPPLKKRIEEYRELGMLDIPCNLASNCTDTLNEKGDAIRYSISALLIKSSKFEFGSSDTHRLNNIANTYCDTLRILRTDFKKRSLHNAHVKSLNKLGYATVEEWCSRLAQMWCDFESMNESDIKEGIDWRVKRAAEYILVGGGYASCVSQELLDNLRKEQYHRSILYMKKIENMTEEEKEIEANKIAPPLVDEPYPW